MPVEEEQLLSASEAAVRCFVESQGRATIDVLAAAAGISQRTWHRYFPAKEDMVRPLLRATGDEIVRDVARAPADEHVCAAFVAAFAHHAGGEQAGRARRLMVLMSSSPPFSAVLDNESTTTAIALRGALAARLGQPPTSPLVTGLASTLTALAISAIRDAAVEGDDPHRLLAERVDALGLHRLGTPTAVLARATG